VVAEGFGEADGGGGAAFREGVEEDVGVEGCGVGYGGDGGEKGAALFARGAVGEIIDGGCDDHYRCGGESGSVARGVLCDVFVLRPGPGEEEDEVGGLESGDWCRVIFDGWYVGFAYEYGRREMLDR
jgi:hypothetical protein